MKTIVFALGPAFIFAVVTPAFDKNGTDDPAGDDRGGCGGHGGDDGPGHT